MIALLLLAARATQAPGASIAVPVAAPLVAASPAIAPELRAAAEEVVRVARVAETLHATAEKQLATIRTGSALSAQLDQNPAIRLQRAKNPQAWDAAIARIAAKQADAFAGIVTDLQPAITEQAIRTYAANFSVRELRQLADFYRTPLGRKLVERTPAISNETALWLQQELPRRLAPVAAALAPEIQREIAPLLPQSPPPSRP